MRTILLMTAAAVALTPLAATAAPAGKARTLSFEYTGASGATTARASAVMGCSPRVTVLNRPVSSCAQFDTQKGERTLVLEAVDAGGHPTGLLVYVGDAPAELACGSARLALPPKQVTQVRVEPVLNSRAGCTATATRGTIVATLTR